MIGEPKSVRSYLERELGIVTKNPDTLVDKSLDFLLSNRIEEANKAGDFERKRSLANARLTKDLRQLEESTTREEFQINDAERIPDERIIAGIASYLVNRGYAQESMGEILRVKYDPNKAYGTPKPFVFRKDRAEVGWFGFRENGELEITVSYHNVPPIDLPSNE